MTRPPRLLAIACLLAAIPCVSQQLKDPANLAGERVSPQALADDLPINHGAPALEQLLLKLRTRASMMLIVAHPDDEDGGFLTYESRGQGARVAMLTLTRGEGGQNLMSADFDDALGLIRTQELLAADRYLGVDQFFGTEVDFGFSKTKEETLEKWTHDRVLYDAVRCVRLYRPLVIASVFVGGPTDGHGHHQVAGEIAQEVFVAAADPKVFPEMGLAPWAPLKVYARVPFSRVTGQGMFDYATGKTIPVLFHNYVTGTDSNSPPVPTVQIHEGDPAMVFGKPALGMDGLSYVQFARKGLALQKTQIGPGVRQAPAGRSDSGYTLMASRVSKLSSFAAGGGSASVVPVSELPAEESSIFDGIDTSILGIATLAPSLTGNFKLVLDTNLRGIDQNIAEAQARFDPNHLELTADPLRTALVVLDTLIEDVEKVEKWPLPDGQKANLLHELRVKRVQLNNALLLALGFTVRAETTAVKHPPVHGSATVGVFSSVPPQEVDVAVRLHAQSAGSLALRGLEFAHEAPVRPAIIPVAPDETKYLTVTAESRLDETRPYFSRPSLEQPFYNLAQPRLRNAPATPDPAIYAQLEFQGVGLTTASVIASDGGPLRFVPPASVTIAPNVAVLPADHPTLPVVVSVDYLGRRDLTGSVQLDLPPGWRSAPERVSLRPEGAPAKGPEEAKFTLTPGPSAANRTASVAAVVTVETSAYREGFRTVGYSGLTKTDFYSPASVMAVIVDVHTAPHLRVAYLSGTGDDVAAFLPYLGVTPTLLNVKDLTLDKLKQYDAVILGVRAYAAHPELAHAGSQPLNDFAAAGGVVIVQYNSGGDAAGTAPYPYNLPGDSAHNVVVEAQPVTILEPNAPLLSWPNKITAADFHNWVAEYGHGFASTWAPEYQTLLEFHDPDQDPQKGGLLVAKVGKGAYIYCALALYRQLPEGVPGAYRLFANLLSYARNPNRPQ